MVIKALDHVRQCYTWEDGKIIASLIRDGFARDRKVVLSFSGVNDVPSSFVNAAFVSLLNDYSFDFIKENLSVIDSTRQINGMIVRRLTFEATKAAAA